MKNKVLITGAEGFVGRNLKRELQSEYTIFTFEERELDFDWRTTIKQMFEQGLECVFHIGACSDTLEQDVNYMMLLNYEVTKYITDLCVEYAVRLVYSSSAANYGVNGRHPSNLYGWSKYAGEGYVISNGGVALRYFNVYGPGEEDKGRMASVAYQMYKRNQNNEEIKLFPKKPLRDFVYVKDIISANLYACDNHSFVSGNWYEVGSGDAKGFEDKMDIMGLSYTYHPENIIPEGYQFYTCSDKNKWMEGWLPEYDLESGLKDYVKYLATQG